MSEVTKKREIVTSREARCGSSGGLLIYISRQFSIQHSILIFTVTVTITAHLSYETHPLHSVQWLRIQAIHWS